MVPTLQKGFSRYSALLCDELVEEAEEDVEDIAPVDKAEVAEEHEDLSLDGLVSKAQAAIRQMRACGPAEMETASVSLDSVVKTTGAAVKALQLEGNRSEGAASAVDEILRQLVAVMTLRRRLAASGTASSSEGTAAALVLQRHQRRAHAGGALSSGAI